VGKYENFESYVRVEVNIHFKIFFFIFGIKKTVTPTQELLFFCTLMKGRESKGVGGL
jgi:hypothetical protein